MMADLTPVMLRDPSPPLSAVYVPGAGMIATSLSDGGIELLGQRRGLDAYLSAGKTMGIPLLYPWANRLSAKTYDVDGETVTLTPDAYGVRPDNNGLPIHGLLAAYPRWRAQQVSDQKLTAELDFGAQDELHASFPFPHLVELTVELSNHTLTVSTTVTPTADKAVPLVYGYHPYLQLPDVPRHQWQVELPTTRQLILDDTGIPTGGRPKRRQPRNRWATRCSTMVSIRSPTGRYSRCPAADAGWRCGSSGATRPHRCSRPPARRSSASNRWPRPPTHCAAAATDPRGRVSRTPRCFRST